MQKPNILIIISDQLRKQALSCYGDPNIETINIDRLAADGVRFANACSTYPVCVPFRYTLMTGEYAHRDNVNAYEFQLPPSQSTIADEFNAAGYETVYIGKWHLYCEYKDKPGMSNYDMNRSPVPREFQGRWQHWRGFDIRNDPFDTCYFVDDNPTPIPINGYQTDGLFDIAMNFIKNERNHQKPFCMALSVEPPHDPLVAPSEYTERWQDKEIRLRDNVPDDNERRTGACEMLRKYYPMIENLDDNVGRMMSFLEKNALLSNTVVVVISDHGELGGSHGLYRKQYPYEESIGIPFLVFDPKYKGNKVIDIPVCTEDLFPTLLGLAELKTTRRIFGENLTPLIRGEKVDIDRVAILLEFVEENRPKQPFHDGGWRGVRTIDTKYTVLKGKPWQFFDLKNDPDEKVNLINHSEFNNEIKYHHQLLENLLRKTADNYEIIVKEKSDN